jgi:hypothetical protein
MRERERERERKKERERETFDFVACFFHSVCFHKSESSPRTALAEPIPIRGCWSSHSVRERAGAGSRGERGGEERERERERERTTTA